MIQGAIILLTIFTVTTIISIPLGILVAYIRLSKNKIAMAITEFYIWIMRGTPLLLQMIFLYYGLPVLNNNLVFSPLVVALVAFSLNYAAYYAEIFRSGFESIDKGQFEACHVLGFDKITMYKRIILPQVFKRVLPPVSNEIINLVKDTSLVYILGMNDLFKYATMVSNRDVTLMPFLYVGIIYLVMTAVLTKLLNMLEKKYSYYR